MVTRLFDKRVNVDARPPVDRAEEDACLGLQLANDLSEVITAMPVHDHQLVQALPVERRRDVAQQRELSAWIDVDRELDVELGRVDAERHGGKDDNPRA